MARRVEVTPRSDGAIIIECDGEEVEVVVREAANPPPQTPPPLPKPMRTTLPIIDPKRPYTLTVPISLKDYDEVVDWITERHENPMIEDFTGVMLTRRRLNVHKIGQFVDRLHDRIPNIGIHINLMSDKDIL